MLTKITDAPGAVFLQEPRMAVTAVFVLIAAWLTWYLCRRQVTEAS